MPLLTGSARHTREFDAPRFVGTAVFDRFANKFPAIWQTNMVAEWTSRWM
jgi:hypothetical protein